MFGFGKKKAHTPEVEAATEAKSPGLFARLTGVPNGFGLEFAIIIVSVLLFGTSVWLGLRKGIKRLSEANMLLAFGLLTFVLLAGPTGFAPISRIRSTISGAPEVDAVTRRSPSRTFVPSTTAPALSSSSK